MISVEFFYSNAECHYAKYSTECSFFIVMLNAVMQSVIYAESHSFIVMLSVIMQSVVMLTVVAPQKYLQAFLLPEDSITSPFSKFCAINPFTTATYTEQK